MFISLYYQFINIINYFSSTYILFLFFIFGYQEIASETFVVLSLITIFTQGFSANERNVYLGLANATRPKNVILFRVFVGIVGLFLSILLSYFIIGKSNILFHSSIAFVIATNWILELHLASLEKTRSLNIYYFINSLFFFATSLLLIFLNNILLLSIFIFLNSLCNILVSKNLFRSIFNHNLFLISIKFNLGIFSSLLKTVTNFACRYFIINFAGKYDASFLFIGFAIGSFFGTLFDVSYGALFLKKIKNKKFFINCFFTIYIILIALFIFLINNFQLFENKQYNVLMITTLFSVAGAYFGILALQQRQFFFLKEKYRKVCHKLDIYIYSFNFFIVPIIYFINQHLLTMSYFISSIFFYFVYIVFLKNGYSKKIN